jgi:hypothetical protein
MCRIWLTHYPVLAADIESVETLGGTLIDPSGYSGAAVPRRILTWVMSQPSNKRPGQLNASRAELSYDPQLS